MAAVQLPEGKNLVTNVHICQLPWEKRLNYKWLVLAASWEN